MTTFDTTPETPAAANDTAPAAPAAAPSCGCIVFSGEPPDPRREPARAARCDATIRALVELCRTARESPDLPPLIA